KTLAPGSRIGWVSAGKYHTNIEKLKFASTISTNGMLQDAIGRYLESGQFDKHLISMRHTLLKQRNKYLHKLVEVLPSNVDLIIPTGGLSIWIRLPKNINAYDLQRRALERGIGICPGHIFSTLEEYNHYIRINFCPLYTLKVEHALEQLSKMIWS